MKSKLKQLSDREYQIAKLIEKGYRNLKISKELGINDTTVHSYVRRIYQKCDLRMENNYYKLISRLRSQKLLRTREKEPVLKPVSLVLYTSIKKTDGRTFIEVRLEDNMMGHIKGVKFGYKYFPIGSKTGGYVFSTVAGVKESLEED